MKLVAAMPERATLADIMAELYFRQKVDRGLDQLKKGQGISHLEAKTRLKRWLRG